MKTTLREYLWKNRFHTFAYEVAERVGIKKTYLSNVVNGSVIPSVPLAKRIEKETNGEVVWHELIDWCTEMKKRRAGSETDQKAI